MRVLSHFLATFTKPFVVLLTNQVAEYGKGKESEHGRTYPLDNLDLFAEKYKRICGNISSAVGKKGILNISGKKSGFKSIDQVVMGSICQDVPPVRDFNCEQDSLSPLSLSV